MKLASACEQTFHCDSITLIHRFRKTTMMTFLEIRKTRDVNKSICEYQLLNTDCDKQPLTIKNKIQCSQESQLSLTLLNFNCFLPGSGRQQTERRKNNSRKSGKYLLVAAMFSSNNCFQHNA